MNTDSKYQKFNLCREMLETPGVIRRFPVGKTGTYRPVSDRVLLTGEGSSRIFPAKRAVSHGRERGWSLRIDTEAATQALDYDLSRTHVYVASNSGKTAEGVNLIRHLATAGAPRVTGVVANGDSPIARESSDCFVLTCGPEQAVAATKSVVEQALFYDVVFRDICGDTALDLNNLADEVDAALQVTIDPGLIARVASATTIYFSGRNDGVAEELTLKANEITRKRAAFLEGTYALHGIEEVMKADEVVVLIEPHEHLEERYERVLRIGVGLEVVAIASRPTRFPTIVIPASLGAAPYARLAAGWNLLVEIGLAVGIDIDKTERARKVGNEFKPQG